MATLRNRNIRLFTLVDLFRQYLDDRVLTVKDLNLESRSSFERWLRHVDRIGDLTLCELTPERLDRWLLSLKDKPGAQACSARVLKQALLWGRDQGFPTASAAMGLRVPRHRAKRGEPWSREELNLFLEGCDKEAKRRSATVHRQASRNERLKLARETAAPMLCKALGLTALRSGALRRARVDALHPHRRGIQVNTKGRVLWAPVSAPAYELLRQRRELVLGVHDYLFPGQLFGPLRSHSVNMAFKRIADDVGVRGTRHVNDTRHSGITLFREAGGSWVEAAELALHVDPATTRRIYDHSMLAPAGIAIVDRFQNYLEVGHG